MESIDVPGSVRPTIHFTAPSGVPWIYSAESVTLPRWRRRLKIIAHRLRRRP